MLLAFFKMMSFIGKGKRIVDRYPANRIDDLFQNPHIDGSVVVDLNAKQILNLLLRFLNAAQRVGRVQLNVGVAALDFDLDWNVTGNSSHPNCFLFRIDGNNFNRVCVAGSPILAP